MFGQSLLPELKFEKWIKIANLPTGWGVRGRKLGEKEILRIWTVEMGSAVAQRHASKGHFGVYKNSINNSIYKFF